MRGKQEQTFSSNRAAERRGSSHVGLFALRPRQNDSPMNLAPTPFNSPIARRVLLACVLAGVIPILLIGTLSSLQIGTTLTAQARAELQAASRSHGEQIDERLFIAAEVMQDYARQNLTDIQAPLSVLPPSRMFRAAPPGVAVQQLEGLAPASARLRMHLVKTEDGPVPALSIRHGDSLLAAFLAPRYLWGDPAENPYGMAFCVFAAGQPAPLHCSQAVPAAIRQAVAAQPEALGVLEWEAPGGAYTGAYRELSTQAAFGGPVLRILAIQPSALATAPLAAFDQVVPLLVLLALALSLLFAAWQVRRRLQPVEVLLHSTRQFADGDLSHRIELANEDEFAELAGSLNAMAARLSRKFDTLKLFRTLDHMIVAGQHVDDVTDQLLGELPTLFGCAWASVLFVDTNSRSRGKLRALPPGHAAVANSRVVLREHDLELLARLRGGAFLAEPELMFNSQLLTDYQSAEPAYVMPIVHDEQVAGAIMLYPDEQTGAQHIDTAALAKLADRLAVAVSCASRETELHRRAYYDELTGLPNRQLCMDRLEQALAHARRADESVAVLFIDLDRFKVVNDSVGHAGGDDVLREVAARLRRCVREIDTLARLSGDEFLVVLPEMQGAHNVRLMAERILAELAKPFLLGASEVFLSGSIGAAAFPGDGSSAEELIRKADAAMYGAKESGRGRHVAFCESMEAHIQRRIMLEHDLGHALEQGQMSAHYQPQVCLTSGRIVAAEALLRWRHPTEGNVSPTEFIGIAEDCGLIGELGDWVLQRACADLARWRRDGLGIERVTVNISARQLSQPDLMDRVMEAVAAAGIPPSCLELEITESVFADDVKKAASVLRTLKSAGVRICIDDFGTGYSALSYLKKLSFDTVKVDRSFVFDLPTDRDAAAITNAIVAMAHTLGKTVIAEGVMNSKQHEFLQSMGIDLGQGALFSLPLSAANLEHFISARDEPARAPIPLTVA